MRHDFFNFRVGSQLLCAFDILLQKTGQLVCGCAGLLYQFCLFGCNAQPSDHEDRCGRYEQKYQNNASSYLIKNFVSDFSSGIRFFFLVFHVKPPVCLSLSVLYLVRALNTIIFRFFSDTRAYFLRVSHRKWAACTNKTKNAERTETSAA